jgi:hypothetical protein
MKQTAVEYLVKEFSDILGPLDIKPMQDLLLVDAIKRANEMFEQQIEDAFYQTELDEFGDEVEFGQYYNETFKQQEQ